MKCLTSGMLQCASQYNRLLFFSFASLAIISFANVVRLDHAIRFFLLSAYTIASGRFILQVKHIP
jgi:hypothetical protein